MHLVVEWRHFIGNGTDMYEERGSTGTIGAGEGLTAVFLTGNPAIDGEHGQLLELLAQARAICLDSAAYRDCTRCGQSRRAQCEGRLVGVLGDLLSLIVEHFQMEEAYMRDSLLLSLDRLLCESHMEDHAIISTQLEELIAHLDSRWTVVLLRQLEARVGDWLERHVPGHDKPLVDWIEREDSALRSGF